MQLCWNWRIHPFHWQKQRQQNVWTSSKEKPNWWSWNQFRITSIISAVGTSISLTRENDCGFSSTPSTHFRALAICSIIWCNTPRMWMPPRVRKYNSWIGVAFTHALATTFISANMSSYSTWTLHSFTTILATTTHFRALALCSMIWCNTYRMWMPQKVWKYNSWTFSCWGSCFKKRGAFSLHWLAVRNFTDVHDIIFGFLLGRYLDWFFRLMWHGVVLGGCW